jgi:hypothetical protein
MGFEPQNDLERSLIKAANDPAHRPEFYRDLAKSDVFIIQHGKQQPGREGWTTLQKGMTIQIQNIEREGKPYVPIFSSLARLQAALTGEAAYLQLNALELLSITKGSALLLNPGSDYGKEITVEEAASIVDGSIWQATERYVAQKETRVLIGQPRNYPVELVEALTRVFRKKKEVRRAWVAHFFNPERDEKPHTLIAIDASGDLDSIVGEAGIVARDIQIPDPPVDFIAITGKGGVESYFTKSAKPFYVRRFFGLF